MTLVLLRTFKILVAQAELLADSFLNQVDGDALFLRGDDVAQHLLRGDQVQARAGERGVGHQAVRAPSSSRTLDLIDARDVFGDVIGNLNALGLRFFLQDGDFRFEVGRLDVGDQAPLKTRAQALFNRRNFLRRAIGTDDDLPLQVVERVEGVKKFFLRAFLAGDELNVVHQQHVHRAEAVAETDHAVEAQRVDHFVGEFFRADVGEAQRGIALLDLWPTACIKCVLPMPTPPYKEQRVVGFRRLLGHGAAAACANWLDAPTTNESNV